MEQSTLKQQSTLKRVTALLLAVGCASLAGCSTRQSDELALRREFAVPWGAPVLRYAASPAQPGWFGREGLRITMVFQLDPAAAEAVRQDARRSGQWRPLPIPTAELQHLAGIRTALAQRARTAQLTGTAPQPPGTLPNPSAGQMLKTFQSSLQPLPPRGWYQIRTAGTTILWAPKTIRSPLTEDVNDFMLAVLDPATRTLTVRVSSSY